MNYYVINSQHCITIIFHFPKMIFEIVYKFDLKEWENAQIGSPESHNGIPQGTMKSLSIASEVG